MEEKSGEYERTKRWKKDAYKRIDKGECILDPNHHNGFVRLWYLQNSSWFKKLDKNAQGELVELITRDDSSELQFGTLLCIETFALEAPANVAGMMEQGVVSKLLSLVSDDDKMVDYTPVFEYGLIMYDYHAIPQQALFTLGSLSLTSPENRNIILDECIEIICGISYGRLPSLFTLRAALKTLCVCFVVQPPPSTHHVNPVLNMIRHLLEQKFGYDKDLEDNLNLDISSSTMFLIQLICEGGNDRINIVLEAEMPKHITTKLIDFIDDKLGQPECVLRIFHVISTGDNRQIRDIIDDALEILSLLTYGNRTEECEKLMLMLLKNLIGDCSDNNNLHYVLEFEKIFPWVVKQLAIDENIRNECYEAVELRLLAMKVIATVLTYQKPEVDEYLKSDLDCINIIQHLYQIVEKCRHTTDQKRAQVYGELYSLSSQVLPKLRGVPPYV